VTSDVSAVIVTFQNAATVGAAVESLRGNPRVERIVVVDNASDDGSADAARGAGAGEVLEQMANQGFAAGVNRALPLCNGDYVLLLNPDASVLPADLDLLVEALQADPGAVAAGPVLQTPDGALTSGARRFSTASNRVAFELPWVWRHDRFTSRLPEGTVRRAQNGTFSVDYLWGAAVLVRREFLRGSGGLDERFFMYHEDEDLGRQARAQGRRMLLVSAARARHVGAVSSRGHEVLAHARMLFATGQLLDKWSWRGSGAAFTAGALTGLLLQAGAATLSHDAMRRAQRLRCARLLLGFRRRGSARP
jgi:N-acetylglucosaminyl-diphospho-decaprenol L-rhamnosyltransferase